MRRSAWGNGYATEGSRALVKKAFAELDVRLIWGATISVNLPSQRVHENGRGAELGGVQYAITNEQWEHQ